jgi:apolipoprotein N-acyltransferase
MANWNSYLADTAELRPGSVDLVVWPESAAPFLLDADADARQKIADVTAKLGAALVLGAPRSEPMGAGRVVQHNSVYFFRPGNPEPFTYDKRRLLPFVETSPWSSDGNEGFPYAAGSGTRTFDVHGWQVAPLVCFEGIYPEYAAEAVLAGAHVLVNLSNDAWFAGGAGPEQHFAMSRLRTVEVRRAMIRASNGGVSGVIGQDGEVVGYPIRRQKAVRTYEIPPPPRQVTFATRHGDWMVWFSCLLAAGCVLVALRHVRGAAPTGG